MSLLEKNYFVHETSIVDPTANIGKNTKIWAFTHVMSGAVIGENCIIGEGVHIGNNVVIGDNVKIQNNSIIYEGVTIEDNVFIGPSVVTTNDIRPKSKGDWKDRFRKTIFKKGCSIGANSTIVCGNVIGEDSLVGAGSVVTKNVKSNSVVVGNPAKPLKDDHASSC